MATLASTTALAEEYLLHSFRKIQVTDQFFCEGAHHGDFNRDGIGDICAGPFWFAGPGFTQRHEYTAQPAKPYTPATGYSDYFLSFTYDFNSDGWTDILVFSWPGKETAWYENPQNRPGHWPRHVIFDVTDNESPSLVDISGDGKPELLCQTDGYLGYAEADWSDPSKKWTFRAVSHQDKKAWFRYTHGYGAGDVNGDGRVDLLEKGGWWEQPAEVADGKPWRRHAFPFVPNGMRGGSQMWAYDISGDGLADVVTSWDAHGYGLAWYEQFKENGQISFRPHILVNRAPEENRYGVKFTQPHAIDLVDMDGDGLLDLVTGKRFWAHGPNKDAEPGAPPVMYWFRLTRDAEGQVDFVPHLIDNNSGVGTQVTAGDISGDGLPDVVMGNKRGIFVFLQQVRKVGREEWEKAQPKPRD